MPQQQPMRAMELDRPRASLVMRERPLPAPAVGEVRIKISACGVCRADLHMVDGELPEGGLQGAAVLVP